ncbi:JAB domain-containing protein [Mameliella alba]|uniref:JAB domain-containing protein n=1 Tax=Mameliella alba TaxID=561184 RepID=UPI001794D4F1
MTLHDPKEIADRRAPGFSEAEIATIDAARSILRRHARSTAALQSWTMLTDYLALNAVHERVEVFRVLLLDRKNRLIRDRVMTRGSIDHVPVYVSEVLRRRPHARCLCSHPLPQSSLRRSPTEPDRHRFHPKDRGSLQGDGDRHPRSYHCRFRAGEERVQHAGGGNAVGLGWRNGTPHSGPCQSYR